MTTSRLIQAFAGAAVLLGWGGITGVSAAEPVRVVPAIGTTTATAANGRIQLAGWRHGHHHHGFFHGHHHGHGFHFHGGARFYGAYYHGGFYRPRPYLHYGYGGLGYWPVGYGAYYHSSFYRPYSYASYRYYRPYPVGVYGGPVYGAALYGGPYGAPYGAVYGYGPSFTLSYRPYWGYRSAYYGPSAYYYGGYGPGYCW